MLRSYIPKKRLKCAYDIVQYLSSGVLREKPSVIEDYSHRKGGVDLFTDNFPVKHKTNPPYPFIIFFDMLDVVLYTFYLFLRENSNMEIVDRKLRAYTGT